MQLTSSVYARVCELVSFQVLLETCNSPGSEIARQREGREKRMLHGFVTRYTVSPCKLSRVHVHDDNCVVKQSIAFEGSETQTRVEIKFRSGEFLIYGTDSYSASTVAYGIITGNGFEIR